MKTHKKRLKTIILSILLISLLVGGFLFIFNNIIIENNLYCDDTICYSYNGSILKKYYIHKNKKKTEYILRNTCYSCQEKVIKHNENKLLIKENNNIYHYFKQGYDSKTMNPQSLIGLAFKNDNNELYFLDNENIIISNEKGLQKKYQYEIKTYGDEYYSIELFGEIAYTYNSKTKEIFGYQKINKEKLQLISLDIYNSDGSIRMLDKYLISGTFQLRDKYIEEEIYIYKNKVLFATQNGTMKRSIKILDANEKEIYFAIDGKEIEYYYNMEQKKLYRMKDYKKFYNVDKNDLKFIYLKYYNEDTSLKTIAVSSINGAYRYKEENAEKEIKIKDGEITIVEYYERMPENTTQNKYKFSPYTRTDETINFVYKKDENIEEHFEYNIKNKTIHIYYDEYKPIKESELKHIK